MTLVKICGVTLPDDAARVAQVADFIGFNFWPRSKRYLDPARWPLLSAVTRASGDAKAVGVFVDADVDEIAAIHAASPLDAIQLHGDESQDTVRQVARLGVPVWKAVSIATAADVAALAAWKTEAVLLDGPKPGSGQRFDHRLVAKVPHARVVLAGGLTPDNVAAAIAVVSPWAVDVASGVEAAPGVKDAGKLAAFVSACRAR